MHFGEPIADDRFAALLRPSKGIATFITADTYGAGEADALLGRALAGVPRDEFSLVGAIGHDFYTGEREGAKGFPRFTDPRLRGPAEYADYVRMATERSLERCGVDAFDVLLLHNPDRTGYTSDAVWDALEGLRAEGLTRSLGVAPGPANGFTLDVIDCLERFGDRIDWAMVILNPLEPWPGELVLPAAERHDVRVITRVVDYGGLFHDDVLEGHAFPRYDHRGFRPDGWVERGPREARADARDRRPPRADAAATRLSLEPRPRPGSGRRADADRRAGELRSRSRTSARSSRRCRLPSVLCAEEVAEIRALGDNTGSMALKGAAPDYEGEPHRGPVAVGRTARVARVALGHPARARPAQSRLSQRRAATPRSGSTRVSSWSTAG